MNHPPDFSGKKLIIVMFFHAINNTAAPLLPILHGVEGYYNAQNTDEETGEALRRWNAGITVVNANQFERKQVNGSWQVVFAGTETSISGMEVVLSSDPQ